MKSAARHLWDAVGIPFRLALFRQEWLPHFGWTTLEEERIAAVRPWIRGRLLDVGAGLNTLARRYPDGVGVDVHDWGGGAQVIENAAQLPFPDASFDTVTFLACLNHIPNRHDAVADPLRLPNHQPERLGRRLAVPFSLESRGLTVTVTPEDGVERVWVAERSRFRNRTAVIREDRVENAAPSRLVSNTTPTWWRCRIASPKSPAWPTKHASSRATCTKPTSRRRP